MWQLDGPVELLDLDERLTVLRQGSALGVDVQYADGILAPLHAPDSYVVVCTVQPMNGKDLLLVPEGFRDKETLWLWARNDDAAMDSPTVDVGDVVQRSNKYYQVQSAENWGSYNRCMLVACDLGPYGPYGALSPESFGDALSDYPKGN